MVSTIAAALFLTAITLAVWTIARTLLSHAEQIAALYGVKHVKPALPAARRTSDARRPVTVSPLRPASLRAAA